MIKKIRCNVLMDGLDVGDYTSDFGGIKTDCVTRRNLIVRMAVLCYHKHISKTVDEKRETVI